MATPGSQYKIHATTLARKAAATMPKFPVYMRKRIDVGGNQRQASFLAYKRRKKHLKVYKCVCVEERLRDGEIKKIK